MIVLKVIFKSTSLKKPAYALLSVDPLACTRLKSRLAIASVETVIYKIAVGE